MSEPLRTVNVGLIGLGTVGGGVARLIKSHHDEYLAAYGIDLKLTRACALAWKQAEAAGIEREAFTSDWHDVVTDPAVDIVVELIGGEHPATEIFTTAFEHGKHVVSANKALLGRHVETLAEKARACGVQIKCEASCGGSEPSDTENSGVKTPASPKLSTRWVTSTCQNWVVSVNRVMMRSFMSSAPPGCLDCLKVLFMGSPMGAIGRSDFTNRACCSARST